MRKRALKRAEKYYMNEQDLDANEGAFINKVYKNLQNHKDGEDNFYETNDQT